MLAHDIIIRPIITEKSMDQVADRKYTFQVAKGANKIEIKKAVEEIFKVEVEKVTTMNYIGKPKRQGVFSGKRADWKKAVVKLKEGSKTIELFES
ncbi:50S ribosomal protein L23 [Ructibacterium gallinarum]|uniref:Large ribosomal subunit protein uL23 n=1 Tax=Ructibacterium gallinarum TaxID=2779355 RepID=A0A9D5M1G9_9FIRM|nr:50S ribosomal protein L23 [Ructibacterium gallinarum]MBE5038939.1 50S ribosomal protein L23 [Ructibacterium gallinarum]